MAGPQLIYPDINGIRPDYGSLGITLAGPSGVPINLVTSGANIYALKSLNYSDNLEGTMVYGTSATPIGRTRGQYKAEGSMEIYRDEYDALIMALTLYGKAHGRTPGFMEVAFNIQVSYAPSSDVPMITDTLYGVRLKKNGKDQQAGADPLAVKCDLSIMRITHNGQDPVSGLIAVNAASVTGATSLA